MSDLKIAIDALVSTDFTKPNAANDRKIALQDKVNSVLGQIEDGEYRGAFIEDPYVLYSR